MPYPVDYEGDLLVNVTLCILGQYVFFKRVGMCFIIVPNNLKEGDIHV